MTANERSGSFAIRRAEAAQAEAIAPLFDAYRQFYDQPADLQAARVFLAARLANAESIVFAAWLPDGSAVGFTQLYPTFSSVQSGRVLILNDLYVGPEHRGHGVARALMITAADHGRATGAHGLELATAHTNLAAQALYESLGWVRDSEFLHYELPLNG